MTAATVSVSELAASIARADRMLDRLWCRCGHPYRLHGPPRPGGGTCFSVWPGEEAVDANLLCSCVGFELAAAPVRHEAGAAICQCGRLEGDPYVHLVSGT